MIPNHQLKPKNLLILSPPPLASFPIQLSIVIPVYNGEFTIEGLVDNIFQHLSEKTTFEIIMVNDASTDNSWEKLCQLHQTYSTHVTVANLARNFGEHNAVMAGYHLCQGQYIVNIDDDFQNPPSEILKLLHKIQEGYDAVYSLYETKQHARWRNWGSQLNNWMATLMLHKPKALYLSSFRMISFSLLQQIIQYGGPFAYIDGLILRATSRIAQVHVQHLPRTGGHSNYTLRKLLRLWASMFFNFSLMPLRISALLGILIGGLGFLGSIAVVIEKVLNPDLQVGWASLIVSVLMLSGTQLFVLGLIGEYIGRMFLVQNQTPQFVLHQVLERQDPSLT